MNVELHENEKGKNRMQNQDPLIVCLGRGQDSYGMLCGMHERGIKPVLIIFADVGNERVETYQQAPIFDAWIRKAFGIAPVTVRYQPKNFKHWPHYHTLLENCLTNVTLPSLAYGYHTCSAKWKISAINAYLKSQPWAQAHWNAGGKIRKAIGFDNSPHEQRRAARGCKTFAIQEDEKDRYELTFPLQEWGWTREDCLAAIKRAGLPVPPKSSCFFCPAMKPAELDTVNPSQLRRVVILEARTRDRHLNHAREKNWPAGVNVPLIDGLWRKPVKGCRGATPRPGSMTEYIRAHRLLDPEEVDYLATHTPTRTYSKTDFEVLGVNTWEEWIERTIAQRTREQRQAWARSWLRRLSETLTRTFTATQPAS